MAWLCVDKDGTEWISSEPLDRFPYIEPLDKRKKNQVLSKDDQYCWAWPYYSENLGERVCLPKGSIQRLIGRELIWDDDPIEYL